MTQELTNLLREYFDYSLTNVHTTIPGQVVKYDYKTRRADIQPSIKRKMPNGKFVDFPIIPDVPVLYYGTSKYTIHIPLEKDDEVLLIFCERGTDIWRDSGDKGIEEPDPRRFALNDCYVIPGLQPIHFIPTPEKGISIIHQTKWDGKIIDKFVMDDDQVDFIRLNDNVEKDSFHFHLDKDEVHTTFIKDDVKIAEITIDDSKIETLYKDISSTIMEDNDIKVKYKQKCQALMEDDHMKLNTEKCIYDMTADILSVKNSSSKIELNAGVITLAAGDGAKIVMDANFTATGSTINLN